MIDLRKHLNQAQYEAVTAINGPLLVIAGAGSGKTRVIEYRVLNLVQNNIKPSSILLLTFTKKAAAQMLGRASTHDQRCKNIEGGTFHSFAYRVLKRYAPLLGFDSFSILDEGDAEDALRLCMRSKGDFEKDKRFPKKQALRNIISMAVNKHSTIEKVLFAEYPAYSAFAKDIEEIKKEYASYKAGKAYLDYDDLLIFLRDLLKNHKDVREALSAKYGFIMVDEYQDTNKLQSDIVYLLAGSHNNVMAVGDDAQSIYGFRGASHENIMEFPKKFQGCKIITLEENYRSSQPILDVANAVLKDMQSKYSKHLISATKCLGRKPQLLFFNDIYEEAEWVAAKIKELWQQGTPLPSQAVLFRSAYISIPLQAELSKMDIPYEVFGGLRFYETAHVKDVISYLKVLHNLKDELAWNRLLMLIEGIGPKTAERLLEQILACNAFPEITRFVFSSPQKAHKYSFFLKELGLLFETLTDKQLTLSEQFEAICSHYEAVLKAKFDDWDARAKDLEVLQNISGHYQALGDFLADFAIEPPDNILTSQLQAREKSLVLSTIHSAKGLEWDYVFLVGMMDGILPVSFSLHEEDGIEEEHRLFYVALTRAKKELFLSLYQQGAIMGRNQYDRISRFLDAPAVLSKLEKVWNPLALLDSPD